MGMIFDFIGSVSTTGRKTVKESGKLERVEELR